MRQARKFREKVKLSDDVKMFVLHGNMDLTFMINNEFTIPDSRADFGGYKAENPEEKAWWDKYKNEIMKFWESDMHDSEWFENPELKIYGQETAQERKKSKPRLYLKYGMD